MAKFYKIFKVLIALVFYEIYQRIGKGKNIHFCLFIKSAETLKGKYKEEKLQSKQFFMNTNVKNLNNNNFNVYNVRCQAQC